ncbi:Cytochrome P450 71B29 [Acorus gramineus]|uniref:Cytochrome P450 71B29 n=1 Tax=Acorus gramineus TaxID=55184 RepID=A0AAV9BK01_ACOGR|nr:Cytochrome P450 71B29 [Acorus gramineus]
MRLQNPLRCLWPAHAPPPRPTPHGHHFNTPDAARAILKTHDSKFCSRAPVVALHRLSYGGRGIAFAPHNARWKQARKLATVELFSAKRTQYFKYVRSKRWRF